MTNNNMDNKEEINKSFAVIPKQFPYYACIFSSVLRINEEELENYNEMADKMDQLAKTQPGYLGIESTRNRDNGFGITVSYWKNLSDIKNWKANSDHQIAQEYGISNWYQHYELKICEVKYSYGKSKIEQNK